MFGSKWIQVLPAAGRSGESGTRRSDRGSGIRQNKMIDRIAKKIGLVASLGVVAILAALPDPSRAARPNIVVIQTDDQSVSSLRATYRNREGKVRKVMPNTLREVFRGGTEFTRTYATSPLCSPSRASVLTGQYPHNNGLIDNDGEDGGWSGWQALPTWTENVPKALQDSGYRTSHFGKFTNSYWNEEDGRAETAVPPGWSRWFTTSFRSGDARYYGYRVNDDGVAWGPFGRPNYRLRDTGIDNPTRCTAESLVKPWLAWGCNYLTDVMTREAVAEIRRGAGPGRKPFYLHLDYQAPHGDVVAPSGPQPASRHLFSARRARLDRPPNFNEPDFSDKPAMIRDETPRFGSNATLKLKKAWQRTLESLQGVDDGVGAIFETLRETGQLRNTFVFFTSDNGYFFGEHRFTSGKSLPYEPAARVPLAVRGPGVPEVQRASALVSTMDIGATALALAGATTPYETDGRSLRPLWRGTAGETNRGLMISLNRSANGGGELSGGGLLDRTKPPNLRFEAVRIGPYKYVEYLNGDSELYDLSRDRWELRNKVEAPRWAPVVTYMAEQLELLRECVGAECRQDLPPWPEPDPLERGR